MQAEEASRGKAKGEGPERGVGMIARRKYGVVVEEEGEHLLIPAKPFCSPCNCFLYLCDEEQLYHWWRSSL